MIKPNLEIYMSHFYNQKIEQIIEELKTQENKGLSSKGVRGRLLKYGLNKLPEEKTPSAFIIFLKQFNNIFTYILLGAAVISFLLQEYTDIWVILAAIVLNVIIGFVQENKAQKTVSALRKMIIVTSKVLREGRIKTVAAEELVPGDIIFINAGDKIPADARLIETLDFQVNEASLTGESVPSRKDAKKILSQKTSLAERENMAYMGTVAISGKAKAVVVNTGTKTEIGQIASLVAQAEEEKTPLQQRIKKLSIQIAFAVAVGLLILILGGVLTGRSLAEMFIFSVAIAVAAIPEGLVVAVTIILALGMKNILKKRALVKELLTAENLGSTTVICTDKTGTVTSGEMKAEKIVTLDKIFLDRDLSRDDPDLKLILKISVLCNDIYFEDTKGSPEKWKLLGDPTEKALIVAAGKTGLKKDELEKELNLISEIPFDSYLKYMACAYQSKEDKKIRIFIKGSAERLLERAEYMYKGGQIRTLNREDKEKILKTNENLSQKAYRVIAMAYKEIEKPEEALDLKEELKENLVFAGLVGIRDSIRPGVKEAIKLCQSAGIKVKMITGDHKLTAQAIAKEVGLKASNEEILSGEEFDLMGPEDLEIRVPKIKIFARVAPRHKLEIVDILQRQKEIVAMTGDGVNDAPALKAADIGIAMGTGTEVAKEVSDIILLNNNFKTIERAIEEGRGIFDNIRKVVLYLLSDGLTELILVGGSLLLGFPLPLIPVQILWVNLVEDGLPSLALAFESREKEVMKDPPRSIKEPILNLEMKVLIFLIGIITDLVLFGLFIWLWKTTGDLIYARTMIFVALGIDSLFYVFSCRSLRRSIWHLNPFSNKFLVLAVAVGLLMFFIALYIPFFQTVLKTVPLDPKEWLILLSVGVFNLLAIEIAKRFFIAKQKSLIASSGFK